MLELCRGVLGKREDMSEETTGKSWQELKQQIQQEISTASEREKKRLTITYCGGCGYEPRAEALAFEVGRELGIAADLYRTTGGLFEVDFGESRIFSKLMLGRFPEEGEVLKTLRARLGK